MKRAKKSTLYRRAVISTVTAAFFIALVAGCASPQFRKIQPGMQFGDWEVVASSSSIPEGDSLWFLINPARPQSDSALFNGFYTSSYVTRDSLRAVIVYDSILGYRAMLKRYVTVEKNPETLYATARTDSDTVAFRLSMVRDRINEDLYYIHDRAPLDSLLSDSLRVHFTAITPGGYANPNAQVYTFTIDPRGFSEARARCIFLNDSLPLHPKKQAPDLSEELFGV